MPLLKTNKPRRREVRKHIPRKATPWENFISRGSLAWMAVIAGIFICLALLIVIQGREEPAYRVNQIVDRPRMARVKFDTLDAIATEKEREKARSQTPAVYVPNTIFFDETRNFFTALPATVVGKTELTQMAPEIVSKLGLTEPLLENLRLSLARYQKEGKPTEAWQLLVDDMMTELGQTAILPDKDYQVQKVSWPYIRILLQHAEPRANEWVKNTRLTQDWLSVENKQLLNLAAERLTNDFAAEVRPAIVHYYLNAKKPTYEFSKQLTDEVREAAVREVKDVMVTYQPGDVLVPAGTVMRPQDYRLLQEHLAAIPTRDRVLNRIGLGCLVTLIGLSLLGYVIAYKTRITENPMRCAALFSVLLAALLMAWAFQRVGENVGLAAVLCPTVLVGVILTIAYDQRFGLGSVVLFCLLAGVALNLTVSLILVMIVTSMVAIGQLREIRHRSTLGRIGLVTGIVGASGVWAAGLADRVLIDGMVTTLMWESVLVLGGCTVLGFIVLGLLPFVERAFRVTTAMTLLELGDMNHPLLRRMAQEAPGTFNHSLQVATLAEAAAVAIGGNGLLARVGAYYHDIGKVNKPQYFVENQLGSRNLHDKLSPAMSLLIIVGHVKDGMEMAREYGLPPALWHFIEAHHGTTLVEYFYHAAIKRADGEDEPEEIEYRYPGPKPRTKEAAALMLCDAVESASRTMAEPTAVRIEQLVHKLATKRLMDGQFSDCDITLADLRRVEEAITKSLCAIYHGRIAYPSSATEPVAAKPTAVAG